MRARALARMGDHRLPKRVLSGKLEDAEKRARVSRQEKQMGGLCGRLHLNIHGQGRFENHSSESFNHWGGRGCHKFVPVWGGNGTILAPPGDLFDQPLGERS